MTIICPDLPQDVFRLVMLHEGGYTEDHTGPVNAGIGLAQLQEEGEPFDLDHDGAITRADLRALDDAHKFLFYSRRWQRGHYDLLHPSIFAARLFDFSVLAGDVPAIRAAQIALSCCGWQLREDGLLGPITAAALNSPAAAYALPAFRACALWRLADVIAAKPTLSCYAFGWRSRVLA